MKAVVKTIAPGSPAAKTIIAPGDVLRKINKAVVNDVLDYEYHSYDSHLLLELNCPDGRIKLVKIHKPECRDLGIEFETYLMDKERSCVNKCIFCFIDQLPAGMRKTLYYKDDDVRLSFLQGNYVTLTNLSNDDIERIIKLRISPINVSVHTLDLKLRTYMLGSEKGGSGIEAFRKLANAGITLNCQIVCCPKINDGRELSKTIEGLIEMGECINSVSIVPVGITRYREGLAKLQAFDKTLALQTVKQVEHYGDICLKASGSRRFFCADELYMMAELELPENDFYEEYPQLENGVGMMRLLITDFENTLENGAESSLTETEPACGQYTFSIVTGVLAYKYLKNLLITAAKKYDTIIGEVYAIKNSFFGESVTVSGLITGKDIFAQLNGKNLGTKLLIPQNMLRYKTASCDTKDDEVFLDGMTVSELSGMLGTHIQIVGKSGVDLLQAMLGGAG